MKKMLKLSLSLFAVCLAAALALSFANQATKAKIQSNAQQKQQQMLLYLFPECDTFENMDASALRKAAQHSGVDETMIQEAFWAKSQTDVQGCVLQCQTKGFGGEIVFFAGFDTQGNTVGVRVLSHAETPGLGAKAAQDAFLQQFLQDPAAPSYTLVKNSASSPSMIVAVSAATISSQAITDGVNAAKACALALLDEEGMLR